MIESATYTKEHSDDSTNTGIIMIHDGVRMLVPIEPANRHYQEIQEWVAEGNTIEESS